MSHDGVEVCDFQASDQDAVRSLILAGLEERWGHVDNGLNSDLDDIGAAYGPGRTVVVRLAGAIVATGTIVSRENSTAEILRMSVAADCRRGGLGKRIVEDLISTARDWGATAVVLETSTGWHDAVAFYRACDFVITHYETGPFGPDTWFRRNL